MLGQNRYSNTVGVSDDMNSRITGLFEGAYSASGAVGETIGSAAPREPANENEAGGFAGSGTRTYGYDARGLSVSPAAKPRVLELA